MIDCVLSVDIGTTSLKAAFITVEGEVVSFSRDDFSKTPAIKSGNFILDDFFSVYYTLLMQTKNDGLDVCVKAIAFSGNGPSLVDERGNILVWHEKVDEVPNEVSLFLPRILGFKKKYPDAFKTDRYIYSGPEFLIWQLTGKAITILPEKRFESAYWNNALLEKYNIPVQKMPPFVSIGADCGAVQIKGSNLYGVPVFGVGPDFVAALIGTGTIAEGRLCDRCGSSEGYNLCVSKYISGDGVRSLPSAIPGLWNASVLIPDSYKYSVEERIEKSKQAIETLKNLAQTNNLPFPKKMVATGGQTKDKQLMAKKAEALGIQIQICHCSDAELLGDACVAWTSLGVYDSLQSAADTIVGL